MKLPCFLISSCVLLLKSPATAMTVKLTPGLVFLSEQLSSYRQSLVIFQGSADGNETHRMAAVILGAVVLRSAGM